MTERVAFRRVSERRDLAGIPLRCRIVKTAPELSDDESDVCRVKAK